MTYNSLDELWVGDVTRHYSLVMMNNQVIPLLVLLLCADHLQAQLGLG